MGAPGPYTPQPQAAPAPGTSPYAAGNATAQDVADKYRLRQPAYDAAQRMKAASGIEAPRAGTAGALAGIAIGSAAESAGTPTANYRRRLGMDPNGDDLAGDLGARTVGVMSDFGAKVLDAPVDLLNAGSRMFGGKGDMQLPDGSFSDSIRRQDGENPTPDAAAPLTPNPSLRPATGAGAGRASPGFDDPRRVDRDPSRASLGTMRDYTNELANVPRDLPGDLRQGVIYKTKGAHGETVYSGKNVTGDAQLVDGKGATIQGGGSVSTVPGVDPAAVRQALANPDGSRWSAGDNAIMAANLRDGVDPYRGTSRQTGAGKDAQMDSLRALASNPNAIGHNGAARLLGTLMGDDTARRGQDINENENIRNNMTQLRGQDMTNLTARARMQYDMNKDQRDFAAGRSDADFTQRQAAKKAMDEQIDARFTDPATGKVDPVKADEYKQFMNNGIADTAAKLKASNDPREQALGKKLDGRSYADMDPEDHSAMEQLWQNREASRKANGWMPTTGNFTDSLRPKDWAPTGVDSRTIGGDHVQFKNGSHVSVNDLTGSTLGLGPKQTAAFDPTLRAAQEAQLRRQGR
jgi:hypothetical protein